MRRIPLLLLLLSPLVLEVQAADLIVHLENPEEIHFVGATVRWDADGNPTRAVDPKAKIEAPGVDAVGKPSGVGEWRFSNLAPGRYDLVILKTDKVRIEGFGYPPVLEFDPFGSPDDQPSEEAIKWITDDIAKSRYYENKVTPLYFSGNENQVRVFVQLLRDQATSYDAKLGQPAATLRHEVWQYTNRYGAWSKEKRTRVFDRLLMPKQALQTWTWIWEPELGMIEIKDTDVDLSYRVPSKITTESSRGLLPY